MYQLVNIIDMNNKRFAAITQDGVTPLIVIDLSCGARFYKHQANYYLGAVNNVITNPMKAAEIERTMLQ